MYNNSMKNFITKTLRFLITSVFVVLFCINFTACQILPFGDNNSVRDLLNGVYDQKIITANVSVDLSVYDKTFYGSKVNETVSHGSGVIFKKHTETGGFTYFALTNNHVTYLQDDGRNYEYTITDCYNNVYQSEVLFSSADYDLAIVAFKSAVEYKVLSFAKSNPRIDDLVIAFGSPSGISNTVTFGTIKEYGHVTLSGGFSKEMSNVKFLVANHDAYMDSGSSGGVLLDKNYNICGINYAAAVNDNGKFLSGYAIPLERIIEFINMQK